MKQGWKFRRAIALIGVLSLSIFAWGCGQTAPTGVDLNDVQSIQTQGPAADITDGSDPTEWY